jgi:hypothetical protein
VDEFDANEAIVRVECNELADINTALVDLAKVTGVSGATVLMLRK